MLTPADLKWDENGLIPAVVQDVDTGQVLTLAFVSRESLAKTLETGETVFWSRSRQEIWHKGATSGNFQRVVSVAADCDQDALVIQVHPAGPACHTGATSCFFQRIEGFEPQGDESSLSVLRELEYLIARRRTELPEGSYTTKLFRKGRKRILQKVGEEATETILAAIAGDREETVREAADLVYHLLVALRDLDIPLSELTRELKSRRTPDR